MPNLLTCRVAWMKFYRGVTSVDVPRGGGSFVNKHGFGAEVFNFAEYGNVRYGFVQGQLSRINVDRIGASLGAATAEDVTVVWVATRPKIGGQYVVGWYKQATVYRSVQSPLPGIIRTTKSGFIADWNVSAESEGTRLLSEDERIFRIPSRGPRTISQANTFYPETRRNRRDEWVSNLISFQENGVVPKNVRRQGKRPNQQKIREVEASAINAVLDQYAHWGFDVESVETQNLGWDLEAIRALDRLRIEVKGTAAPNVHAELTPNEYDAFRTNSSNYRLCVVTDALNAKKKHIHGFQFDEDSGDWGDVEGCSLSINEKTAAIVSA